MRKMSDALDSYDHHGMIAIPLNGKRPFFKNWTQQDHTPYDRSVFINKNIGILTGRTSKITVLDIDMQDDGIKHWKALKKMYPDIITPMVLTPNKGLHLYFKYNSHLRSSSKIRLNGKTIGWDILNDGRQVVAPPSDKYKWIHSLSSTPLAKMPQWLEQYILLLSTRRASLQ